MRAFLPLHSLTSSHLLISTFLVFIFTRLGIDRHHPDQHTTTSHPLIFSKLPTLPQPPPSTTTAAAAANACNNGHSSEDIDGALDSGYGGSSSGGQKASDDTYVPSVGGRGTPRRKPSTRLLAGARMRVLVLDSLIRTRSLHPSRRLGGKHRRILPLPLSAALKIWNGLVPALCCHWFWFWPTLNDHKHPQRLDAHDEHGEQDNESTIAEEDAEEDVEVPCGRESGSTVVEEREHDREVDADADVEAAGGGGGRVGVGGG